MNAVFGVDGKTYVSSLTSVVDIHDLNILQVPLFTNIYQTILCTPTFKRDMLNTHDFNHNAIIIVSFH